MCAQDDRKLLIKYAAGNSITNVFAEKGDRVKVSVVGRGLDGQVFWKLPSLWFTVGAGEVPKGLDKGIRRVSLAQRACLVCAPEYAQHPWGGITGIPDGQRVVFDVTLEEIAAWTAYGKEVGLMRATAPGQCISTLIKTTDSTSLESLFPNPDANNVTPTLSSEGP